MFAKDLQEILSMNLKVGSGGDGYGSIFVEGAPGIGKSEVIAQVAKNEQERSKDEIGFVDFRLLLHDVTDLIGLPMPNLETQTAIWLSPESLPMVGNDTLPERGIILMDDMTTAPPLIQAAAYQFVLPPHKIGNAQLKPGWIIVAAGNRTGDKALVHKMPMPLANRFTHLTLDVNVDDWMDWAVGAGINYQVVSFMKSDAALVKDGHLLFQFDPKKDEKAFPTPRSWVRASKWLDSGLSAKVERELIIGTIGSGAAAQFDAYRKLFTKIPPSEEILVKKNFKVTPVETDLKYVMVTSVAMKAEEKQVDTAVEWAVTSLPTEFGILLIKMLAGKHKKAIVQSPNFKVWVKDNKDVKLAG